MSGASRSAWARPKNRRAASKIAPAGWAGGAKLNHTGDTGLLAGRDNFPASRDRVLQARRLESGDFDRRDRLLEGAWSITRQRSRSQPGGVARRPGCDRYFSELPTSVNTVLTCVPTN